MSQELRPADERKNTLDTFNTYIQDYLRYLLAVRNLSPNTVRAYRIDLEGFSSWLAREAIDPFTVSHRQLRRWLGEQTRARYATATVDRRLSAVRDLYRWLVSEGLAERDCAAAVSSPKKAKTLPRTMSSSDVEKMLETCDESLEGLRDRAFLELLCATGGRIQEASRLNVSDVDFSAMQVRLFGKGSKERIVPIYPAAAHAVRAYLDDAREQLRGQAHKLSLERKRDAAQALFISTRGRRMSEDALRSRFKLHARQAGLGSDITPHAMRHTYATELLAGGADMRSVQELLGHANLATTQVYTHLSVDRLKEATRLAHPRAE